MPSSTGQLKAGTVEFGPNSNQDFKIFPQGSVTLTPNPEDNSGHIEFAIGPVQSTQPAFPSLLQEEYTGDITGTQINRNTKIQEAIQVLDSWTATYLLTQPPVPTHARTSTSISCTIELTLPGQKRSPILGVNNYLH